MKFAAAVLALGLTTTASVAAPMTVSFHGFVDDYTYTSNGDSNTPYAVGQNVTGSYTIDTSTGVFSNISVGIYSTPAGSVQIPYTPATAIAQLNVGEETLDPATGSPTSLFELQFVQENLPYPSSATPAALGAFLAAPYYSTDLSGGAPSQVDVFVTNADGSVSTLGVVLAPEPASMAVLAAGLAVASLVRRRR